MVFFLGAIAILGAFAYFIALTILITPRKRLDHVKYKMSFEPGSQAKEEEDDHYIDHFEVHHP